MSGRPRLHHAAAFKQSVVNQWNTTALSADAIGASLNLTREQVLGIVHRAQKEGTAQRRRPQVQPRRDRILKRLDQLAEEIATLRKLMETL